MKRTTLYLSLCLLSSASFPSFAQDGEEDLYLLYGNEDMISIATGVSQPVAVAPSTASVITSEDIKAMGASTIDEVLERVPGLHAIPSTVNRLEPVYTFRGIYTAINPQVLFMLNGHRIVTDLSSGSIFLNSKMNVENISRIEVIRGSGSAIYGADAYAGVINIITKDSEELSGLSVGAKTGSFGTKDVWAHFGGDLNNDWKIAINIEFAKQDADESRVVQTDGISAQPSSLAPSYLDQRYEATTYNIDVNSKNWNIGLDGWIRRDMGVGAGAAQVIDHNGYDDLDHYLFTTEYINNDLLDNWELSSIFSYQYSNTRSHFDIFPAGTVLPLGADGNIATTPDVSCPVVTPPGVPLCFVAFPDGVLANPGTKNTVPQLDLIGLFDGWEHHTWRFNLGIREEKLETNETKNFGQGVLTVDSSVTVVDATLTDLTGTTFVFVPNKDRTIRYISIQDIWEFAPDWSLTAGVRYDKYSDFGSTTNPRAALVWSIKQNLIAKLLYGRAFRAPSFNELFTKNNNVISGNANLNPETIETIEFDLAYEFSSSLKSNLNIYTYETKDMIEFVAGASVPTAQNINSIEGEGVEVEINWGISDSLDLLMNYSHQKTEDKTTNLQQAFVPQNQAYFDLRWKFIPGWQVGSQLNWVSDRNRESGDTREKISDYTLINLTVRNTNIVKNWEFAATVNNIFDENAREPSALGPTGAPDISDDHPLNERGIFLEARYQFQD